MVSSLSALVLSVMIYHLQYIQVTEPHVLTSFSGNVGTCIKLNLELCTFLASLTFTVLCMYVCMPIYLEMLPDTGMVTTYPKCVLKPANVDRVATMPQIHLLVPGPFVSVGFPCSHPWFQRCSGTPLHLYLFFLGNVIYNKQLWRHTQIACDHVKYT